MTFVEDFGSTRGIAYILKICKNYHINLGLTNTAVYLLIISTTNTRMRAENVSEMGNFIATMYQKNNNIMKN